MSAAIPRAPRLPGAARVPRNGAVLAACCTALWMVGTDNSIVNTGLPAIGRALHASVSGLQWIVAAYTVVIASLLLASGALADRAGRRAVFRAGMLVFTAGCWLCSIAPDINWLIAFRIVQGTGEAMIGPASLGIITATFTGPGRAKAFGIWDGVYGVSMALGPAVGGVLVAAAQWRSIFWANIPVGLAAFAATFLFVPESRATERHRVDLIGQLLIITVLGLLAWTLIEAPSFGWLSSTTLASSAGCAVTGGVLLAWEMRRKDPLIDFRFFRSLPFTAGNLAAVAEVTAAAGFLFLTPLYLQDVHRFTMLHAAVAILPFPAAMTVCAPLSGRIVAWRGPRGPLVLAGVCIAVPSAVMCWLTPVTSPVTLAVIFAVFGAGIGLVSPAITSSIMASIPLSMTGTAAGIGATSRQVGQCLGVAITGSLLATSLHGGIGMGFLHGTRAAFWLMAGCGCVVSLTGATVAARGAWRQPGPAGDPAPS